jgi:hypothetical protein
MAETPESQVVYLDHIADGMASAVWVRDTRTVTGLRSAFPVKRGRAS